MQLDPKRDLHRVVSFDVFDTLVRRPFVDPDDALRFLELKCDVPGWFDARKDAELQALSASGMECVGLSRIYERLPERWRFMEREEIEFDLGLLRPNKDALALYNNFVAAGKMVIIISDTYYDRETIGRLLDACGYRDCARIFVSSESGKTKARGSLFDLVLAELGLADPSEMLHIGDNARSDLRSPMARGIHARKFPGIMESFRKHARYASIERYLRKAKALPPSQRILRSYQVGILAAMHREGYFERKDLFAEMFAYAFPFLLLHFDDFLFGILQETGYKNLAFIARDGYLLKAVFEKRHNVDQAYNSCYVYASRFLIRALRADADGLGDSDAQAVVHFLVRTQPDVARLLEGLSGKELLDAFRERKEAVSEALRGVRDVYSRYLAALSLRGEDVLCIDWGGIHLTAQRFLASHFRRTKGVYCNVCCSVDLDIANFTNRLLPCYELVEVFITSPEEPICAVVEDADGYAPMYGLEAPSSSAESSLSFENVQVLMMRFLDDFDIPALSLPPFPVGECMGIYREILPALSDGDCELLSRYCNCGSVAHAKSDYRDVWKLLQKRYRLPGRIFAAFDRMTSKIYRKCFRRLGRRLAL